MVIENLLKRVQKLFSLSTDLRRVRLLKGRLCTTLSGVGSPKIQVKNLKPIFTWDIQPLFLPSYIFSLGSTCLLVMLHALKTILCFLKTVGILQ